MKTQFLLAAAAAAGSFGGIGAGAAPADARPNFIHILADDWVRVSVCEMSRESLSKYVVV